MPSPITSEDFTIQNFGADVCEQIRKLLALNATLKTFFEWMFEADGTLTQAFKVLMQDVAVAPGAIVFMPVDSVPAGYLVCNGQAVSRTTYINLFTVYGTKFGTGDGSTTFNLPNLQGKFLIGASGVYPVESAGGEAQVTLTEAQLPAHQHDAWSGAPRWIFSGGATGDAGSSANIQGTHVNDIKTAAAGGGQAHNNLPPYQAGFWLVKY